MRNDLFNGAYTMFYDFLADFHSKSICCGYSFELHRQVDAIQMSTYNICLYKEVDKTYTGCNLKTTELLDCVLIGVCAVIRLNMVLCVINSFYYWIFSTLCRNEADVLKMCMSGSFMLKKNFFRQTDRVLNVAVFGWLHLILLPYCSYNVYWIFPKLCRNDVDIFHI